MRWKLRTCIATLALLLMCGEGVRADVLFSNINPTTQDGADGISASYGAYAFGPLADSFTTPGNAENLTDVKLNLLDPYSTTVGSISVDLFSDPPAVPGPSTWLTNLGMVLDSQLSPSIMTFDLPQSTPYALQPNTRYWVELSGNPDTAGAWAWSLDTTGPGVATEFFSNQGGVQPNLLGGPYEMEVDGTPAGGVVTPEPASLILISLAIAALGLRAWITRRRYLSSSPAVP